MLTQPGVDFEGGVLQTEVVAGEGMVPVEGFGAGDGAIFVSHKFHCVTPVTAGIRNVLVLEFWRGEERHCPHRCGVFKGKCPLAGSGTVSMGAGVGVGAGAGVEAVGEGEGEGGDGRGRGDDTIPLPFRLGAADQDGSNCWRILWQPASDAPEDVRCTGCLQT
jgi:hypothetical protein